MQQLPLTIIPNDDWTFTVVSSIFNIVTEWDTLEEAIKNWKDAIQCHVNWYKENPDAQMYSVINFQNSFTTFVAINA